MRRGRAFWHGPPAFRHQVEKRVHGGERLLLAQFLIVTLQCPFNELVDWLAGAFGQEWARSRALELRTDVAVRTLPFPRCFSGKHSNQRLRWQGSPPRWLIIDTV